MPIPKLPLETKYDAVPTVNVLVNDPFEYKDVLDAMVAIYVALTNVPVVLAIIPVLARTETVPVVVIGPPVIPLPVATDVTVPVVGVVQYALPAAPDVNT